MAGESGRDNRDGKDCGDIGAEPVAGVGRGGSGAASATEGESEARFHLLERLAPVGFAVCDAEGRILHASPRLVDMFGYTREDVATLAEWWPRAYPDEALRNRIRREWEGAAAKARASRSEIEPMEAPVTCKDGTVRQTEFRMASNGSVDVIVLMDVTARRGAEAALRQSEGRYQAFVDASSDLFFIKDERRRYVAANRATLEFFGLAREALLGKTDHELMDAAGEARCAESDRRALEAGRPVVAEETVGGLVFETTKFPVPLAGDQQGIGAIIRDITARRRIEEALRKSEEQYRALVESSFDTIMRFDRGLRHVYVNPKVEAETGIPSSAFIGRTHREMGFPERLVLLWEKTLERVFETRTTQRIEFQLPRGYWIDWLCAPELGPDGEAHGVVTMARDVTDRKRAEMALREKAALLEAQLNATIDGILVVDEHAQRVVTNRRIVEIFQVPPEVMADPDDAALLNHVVGMTRQPEEFLAKVKSLYARPTETSRDEIELTNGVLLDRYSAPVLGKDGKYYGRIWTFRDVTERRRAEEEREKLREQLAQANKMESIGRLAGGVAHDFNNMLSVILGHVEMALSGLEPGGVLRSDLQAISKAAKRSADLTRQLLAFARKQAVDPKPLDLNSAVGNMLDMLRRLMGENIVLAWEPGADLWPVLMDPSQLDQILANLCVNSRDAIVGAGSVAIGTRNVELDEIACAGRPDWAPGEYVELRVSDDGCGMDKKTVERVFEPFFTTKEMGKGTGLGLATVYGVVRQNCGFVGVESEPGRGSTFRIFLPRHTGETAPPAGKATACVENGRETVLLVEDDADILSMVGSMLGRLGYCVLPAATPAEAIRLAETHGDRIQLLMTDVIMPEMNGHELAKHLRLRSPGLKVLYVSGYTADIIARHGIMNPGVRFLQKPFSPEDLAARIREALGGDAP